MGALSPRGGVLRFKFHNKRKTNTPNTVQRWAEGETNWGVVSREKKMEEQKGGEFDEYSASRTIYGNSSRIYPAPRGTKDLCVRLNVTEQTG